MLEFTDKPQAYPDTQGAAARKKNFQEIYGNFDPAQAAAQAARCSQCGIPFCQIHCPLQNNIPDWLKLAAEGRLQEAYEMSSATNTFPEICGRICPQDKLCEGNCVIERGFGAVTIGAVEKYITENAFAEGWVQPIHSASETGLSVGIIGAGPAGLSAAEMLRKSGHAVVVYDRHDRAGGLLTYGIPNFKLEKHVVERRIALLREGGVTFVLNHEVRDLAALRAKHDAVLIATGVYKARSMEAPASVIPALKYLIASNRHGFGDALPQTLNAKGREVVVVGGGDTAMDCVRTAVRQGAARVTCLYRRDRANMPGSAREVKNAEEEGVVFRWLSAPAGFAAKDILVQPMRLLPADKSGRQGIAPAKKATERLRADMVIAALGFDAEDLPTLWGEPKLAVSKYGTITVDTKTMVTSIPGVFAAGDIVHGASLVVWAIKDGRDAAAAINRHLQQKLVRAA